MNLQRLFPALLLLTVAVIGLGGVINPHIFLVRDFSYTTSDTYRSTIWNSYTYPSTYNGPTVTPWVSTTLSAVVGLIVTSEEVNYASLVTLLVFAPLIIAAVTVLSYRRRNRD
jgi:hypothetical protein